MNRGSVLNLFKTDRRQTAVRPVVGYKEPPERSEEADLVEHRVEHIGGYYIFVSKGYALRCGGQLRRPLLSVSTRQSMEAFASMRRRERVLRGAVLRTGANRGCVIVRMSARLCATVQRFEVRRVAHRFAELRVGVGGQDVYCRPTPHAVWPPDTLVTRA
jgi:hypothetical protein